MNKVVLIGRLTRDPDIRYRQGPPEDICIARYTLAVDRRYTNQDGSRDADFISCVAFGKNGEFAEKYLFKGMKIAVEGRLRTGSYEKEGRRIYTTDVVVEEHDFCEKRDAGRDSEAGSGAGVGGAAAGGDRNSGRNNTAAGDYGDVDGFMNIPDGIEEELPFA